MALTYDITWQKMAANVHWVTNVITKLQAVYYSRVVFIHFLTRSINQNVALLRLSIQNADTFIPTVPSGPVIPG